MIWVPDISNKKNDVLVANDAYTVLTLTIIHIYLFILWRNSLNLHSTVAASPRKLNDS